MSRIRIIRELQYQKYSQSTSTLVRSVVGYKPTVMLYTFIIAVQGHHNIGKMTQ